MISLSFWKIETKNFDSDPRILIFLVLETASSAAYYLNIRSDNEIEPATLGLS